MMLLTLMKIDLPWPVNLSADTMARNDQSDQYNESWGRRPYIKRHAITHKYVMAMVGNLYHTQTRGSGTLKSITHKFAVLIIIDKDS